MDKSQDFESTGVDIVEELPVEVKEKGSLQLTVYGPNDLGVTKLIQSLTVLDGTEEKALQLPLNADDTPAVTQLNGGTVTVTYHDVEMVNGLLRTKYTIDVTNVRGDITFNSVACRKWVEKAVNVNELEGIAALEYCGPDGEWQSFDVNRLPNQVPFFTCDALDFIEGHYQVVNFRFKLQDGYENPQLKLTKKNGTIDKGELKPDADDWYNFNITIGAKWTGDDILVWFGDNTYQVDMRLTAQPKTSYEAKFYIHEEGKTEASDYTFVGIGSVAFGAPVWAYANDPIELNSSNLNKVTEPSPLTFRDIEVDGVKYTYSADSTAPGTYNFVGWEVAKAAYLDQSGPDAILEWHVDGIIKLNKELPKELQPTPIDTTVTYDGTEKKLNIDYPDGKSENDYVIEYSKDGINWVSGVPSGTNVADKLENIKIRFTMEDYVPYEAPVTYTLEITQRPITLKANDDKIVDGEPIPQFSYTITSGSLAEGDNIIDVTYGGYANKLGIYNLVITGYKIVDAKDNNADVAGNYDVTLLPGIFTIGTSGGGGGTTPTPNPNPNPTPVPVEPETPVTPVTPVTPEEEEEEPEEVETIEEEETPQASPDTDADKEDDKTETIEDEETAQAGAPGEGNWALLNLILMVLTVVAGLGMLALRFARKTGMAHLLGIVPAIVALVAFFVTEDMSLPMAMTDKWTLIMAVIALVQVALLLLGRNSAQDEDEQPREQY